MDHRDDGRVPIEAYDRTGKGIAMMDILMLVLGLGFFAASVGYVYVCEML